MRRAQSVDRGEAAYVTRFSEPAKPIAPWDEEIAKEVVTPPRWLDSQAPVGFRAA